MHRTPARSDIASRTSRQSIYRKYSLTVSRLELHINAPHLGTVSTQIVDNTGLCPRKISVCWADKGVDLVTLQHKEAHIVGTPSSLHTLSAMRAPLYFSIVFSGGAQQESVRGLRRATKSGVLPVLVALSVPDSGLDRFDETYYKKLNHVRGNPRALSSLVAARKVHVCVISMFSNRSAEGSCVSDYILYPLYNFPTRAALCLLFVFHVHRFSTRRSFSVSWVVFRQLLTTSGTKRVRFQKRIKYK